MAKAHKRIKSAAVRLPVPQDDAGAAAMIRKIGDKNRSLMRITAELDDKIAGFKEEYGITLGEISAEITHLEESLKVYCEANRERLTRSGKTKQFRFSTGMVSWRVRPPKCTIKAAERVINAIKEAGFEHFLRIKETINKEAMLADPETALKLPGVSIGSAGEEFIVEPAETQIDKGA